MPIKPRADLTIRDLGIEMILYDPQSEIFHTLNDSARSIWLLLDGKRETMEIQRAFAGLYPKESPEVLGNDLRRTLDEFARRELVQET